MSSSKPVNNDENEKNTEITQVMMDTTILVNAMKNIYAALNKATLKGTFELTEAHTVGNDFGLITQVIDQICKNTEKKKVEITSLK